MSNAQLLDVTGPINDFLNAANILNWDSRTMMPRTGGETRRALESAEAETHNLPEGDVKRVMAQHVRKAIDYHERIPTSVLRRKEELAGVAHDLWADALAQSDFRSLPRPRKK